MMTDLKSLELWLITGSQHLYGQQVLQKVGEHALDIARCLDSSPHMALRVVATPVVTTSEEVYAALMQANASAQCAGVVCWMHTFSPAKMWIRGLSILKKPLLHLHTQYNRDIPWSEIDMDFMNLNQSAHGDREFGFLCTRMGVQRKVVVGHYAEAGVHSSLGSWARAAAGWWDWQGARFVRFGDNMRYVAVTEGDKVQAELQLGYSVNTHGIGDLAQMVSAASEGQVDELCQHYQESYELSAALKKGALRHQSLREAARIEIGLREFLRLGNYKGFTDSFEDLHGLGQLPGLAVQRLMQQGYGFAAEGDWKSAALVRAIKVMGSGLSGGSSFMEDYTYHFKQSEEAVLGAHMLEICPSIAGEQQRLSCEVHPLGIGGKADPVRLVFTAPAGRALNASMVDMGGRFRMLVNEVQAIDPPQPLEKLPVARVLWQPLPDMRSACAAWILAGGAHHTCYSQSVHTEHLEDFCLMAGVEMVLIDKNTELRQFKNQLKWSEMYYGNKG